MWRSVFILLATLGVGLSGYALMQHYASEGSAICDISEQFSCEIVNQGPWSEVFGIPVALIGIAGYAALWWVAVFCPRGWQTILLVGTAGALVYSLYLTYLEAFVIRVWCIVCLLSLLDISLLFLISLYLVYMYNYGSSFQVVSD